MLLEVHKHDPKYYQKQTTAPSSVSHCERGNVSPKAVFPIFSPNTYALFRKNVILQKILCIKFSTKMVYTKIFVAIVSTMLSRLESGANARLTYTKWAAGLDCRMREIICGFGTPCAVCCPIAVPYRAEFSLHRATGKILHSHGLNSMLTLNNYDVSFDDTGF